MDASRIERIRHISGLMKDAEAGAADSVRKTRGKIDRAMETLRQLEAYRDDYHLGLGGDTPMSVSALVRNRVFVQQLERSIADQQRRLHELGLELGRGQTHWRNCRAKGVGLDRIADHHENRRTALAARREQAESDDRACHHGAARTNPRN